MPTSEHKPTSVLLGSPYCLGCSKLKELEEQLEAAQKNQPHESWREHWIEIGRKQTQEQLELLKDNSPTIGAAYLRLKEQLEAQEKMLRAYVERFGLILPTDEPRATVTYPAKGYELHTRTGATPTFAEDDVDSPAISQSECDGTRYCVAETHIHGCFAERAPASRWPGATAFYRSVPNQESRGDG